MFPSELITYQQHIPSYVLIRLQLFICPSVHKLNVQEIRGSQLDLKVTGKLISQTI